MYGTWEYIQVEHPANPADNLNSQQLAMMQPSVTFTRQNRFEIIWDGRRLSAGKYRIDKNMIRITEDLGGGKTREFPFFVSKLTADELIFETLGEEGSKVTAVKHK